MHSLSVSLSLSLSLSLGPSSEVETHTHSSVTPFLSASRTESEEVGETAINQAAILVCCLLTHTRSGLRRLLSKIEKKTHEKTVECILKRFPHRICSNLHDSA